MPEWYYKGAVVEAPPENAIGFVYRILNLSNGKHYIGRKICRSVLKKKLTKKEKLLPENKRKTYKYVSKETDWRKYTGSNKILNADILAGDNIYKEILLFCYTKAELTYEETKAIVCSDCLRDEKCYNEWVQARVVAKNLKQSEE